MQIPAKIKFMSQDWIIRAADARELNNDLGQCDANTNTIILDPHLTPSVMLQTLFHELVHLIEITLNQCLTEQQTDTMATGIVHMFKENPDLLKLFSGEVNEPPLDNE
jgi:hypothetical protein